MIRERAAYPQHPEGLSFIQEQLADLLFDTKISAPVTRRTQNLDGSYSFVKVERLTAPVDFAQEGEFALKLHETSPEARLSPVYINLRNLPPNVLDQVGLVLAEMGGETSDMCAGIPKAGIPLAQAYSDVSSVPVRNDVFDKEQTEKGRRITVGTGGEHQGFRLRIVDDLATQGQTKLEAIHAAEQLGYIVTDIIVLVDRQQGAVQQLAELGYTLRAAFTIDQLLRYGVRTERISQDQYDEVRQYLGIK